MHMLLLPHGFSFYLAIEPITTGLTLVGLKKLAIWAGALTAGAFVTWYVLDGLVEWAYNNLTPSQKSRSDHAIVKARKFWGKNKKKIRVVIDFLSKSSSLVNSVTTIQSWSSADNKIQNYLDNGNEIVQRYDC